MNVACFAPHIAHPNQRSLALAAGARVRVWAYEESQRSDAVLDLDLRPALAHTPTEAESAAEPGDVVQLAAAHGALLVSTTRAAFVVRRAAVTRVGSKLRSGVFGAAFAAASGGAEVLAARPGKRLWRADAASGAVRATLNFTPSLRATPPSALLPPQPVAAQFPARTQPLAFAQLRPLPAYGHRLLLAYERDALFLIDLERGVIVQWTEDLRDILDVSVQLRRAEAERGVAFVDIFVLHSLSAPGDLAITRLTLDPPATDAPSVDAINRLSFINSDGEQLPYIAEEKPAPSAVEAPEPSPQQPEPSLQQPEPSVDGDSGSVTEETVAIDDSDSALDKKPSALPDSLKSLDMSASSDSIAMAASSDSAVVEPIATATETPPKISAPIQEQKQSTTKTNSQDNPKKGIYVFCLFFFY